MASFNGEERFNFLLALIGYLQNRGPVSLAEAAEHFDLEEKYIRAAVTSINELTAEVGDFEQWFFYIDVDALEEDGILQLLENEVIENVPRLSTRQASAIAAGLNYLATIPEFANDKDLIELQNLLAAGSGRGAVATVEVVPGTVEAGSEIIRQAILQGKQIRCEYFNQKGERALRDINPIRLDPRSDGWYLRGYCPINNAMRNFRLDRMRSIEVLETAISNEAKSVGEIDDALYVADKTDTTVVVEVQPEAYRLISEFQNVAEPKSIESGNIRAEIKVGHLPNIARLVAKYGGAAKVIEPLEARSFVKTYALKALGRQPELTNQVQDEE
ncbi:YafY family protein [Rhodoluna sp.]|uniref:helix-turn-helix transcriptional regulator n=1 Tax=Rhodoluna sp. TaxID=1969481 RepID=UPI0025DFEC6A|nr:WYL domain-containing protein [Rhodoluna sp.]